MSMVISKVDHHTPPKNLDEISPELSSNETCLEVKDEPLCRKVSSCLEASMWSHNRQFVNTSHTCLRLTVLCRSNVLAFMLQMLKQRAFAGRNIIL